ncbi:MAG: T9SS type A sorting domain-containing protein [Saprospiraceae bacterium]
MKTHLFFKELFSRLVVLLSFLFLTTSPLSAQECACKSGVNVSLGGGGTATVTPSMMLASNSTCAGVHVVTVMKTPTGSPIVGSPTVNCSHVGQTLYAKVTNGTNSCWGTINVMDEMAPFIPVPAGPLTLTCLEMINFDPNAQDNCAGVIDSMVNESITFNDCSGAMANNVLKRITRTYRAIDKSGNISPDVVFTFYVTIIPSLNDIVMPVPLTKLAGNSLECDGNWAKIPAGQPFAGNPSPTAIGPKYGTGVPTFNGTNLYPEANEHCNLAVGFTDIALPVHKCTRKIVRTWQIIEWSCANRTAAPYDQLIEITDTEAPVITPPANVTFSTSNHTCLANIQLPVAKVEDNCSLLSQIEVDVTYPGGFNNNINGGPAVLPVGEHIVTYTAYDWCGANSSSIDITVTVKDNTPPVSICDEYTTVALANEGVAHVPASVLDDGSYDECSPIKMVVRRMNNVHCAPCALPELPGFHYMGEFGTGADKKYHYLSKHTASPEVAFKMAKALGGNVVTIDSPAKDAWLWTRFIELVNPVFPDWIDMIIGLNDLDGDGKYTWQSGSTATYRNYGLGLPVVPYVVKYHDSDGKWFGYSPAFQAKYVIEISDPCSWSSYAHFCCSDIPNDQMVAFRTIDEAGNYNDCMVSVRVQDKIGPSITCPVDMTVDCDLSFNMSDLVTPFGWPTATDNCEQLTIQQVHLENTLNACRTGSLRRDFSVTDAGSRSDVCSQTITFRETVPFTYDDITWPPNYMNLEGCADPSLAKFSPDSLGRPIFADGFCALVGADKEDRVFSFNNGSGPACFKILRYWTVIDWCQTVVGTSGTTYKTWTHTQTIVVTDKTAPLFLTLHDPVSTCTYDASCTNGHIDLLASAEDNCTDILAYTSKIDLNNDGTFEPVYNKSGYANTINASGTYPVGTHKIVFSFEDKCGNLSTREQLFSIVNCKTPSPVCHHGLSVNLTPMDLNNDGTIDIGMANINVQMFNKGSSHPCNGYSLLFSFDEMTLNGGVPVLKNTLTFDCDSIGLRSIKMWVGVLTPMGQINQAFCSTFIDVQDNLEACEGRLIGGLVSGRVATRNDESVENVAVTLGGSELKYQTLDNGMYLFPNLLTGRDYQVNPFKNDDVTNGISTLDLVWIQRHILGIETLASPYTMIAADVNKDKSINSLDLVDLRKVILGSQENFTNNTSWRFIDKQYKFIETASAHQETFNEKYDIFGFNKDMIVDFVAVKTGDVNESAVANELMSVDAESRNIVHLKTGQQNFTKGDIVRIPVLVEGTQQVAGLQFTANFNPSILQLDNVVHEITSDDNLGLTNLSEGVLTMSWNGQNIATFADEQTLITLEFKARTSGNILEAFDINSSTIRAEMYDEKLSTRKLGWKVEQIENVFVVHQNIPNPFSQFTTIGFEMPEAGNVECTIRDISGKLVKEIKQYFESGTHSFSVNKAELPTSGVYFYTIQTGKNRETKMMVVIE